MVVEDPVIDLFETIFKIDGTVVNGIFDDGIGFPKGKTDTRNVSTQNSGTTVRKRLKRYDPGAIALKGLRIPGDAGQIKLWEAFKDRKPHFFSLYIPDGGETITYTGLVGFVEPGNDDSSYVFNATIEVSGEPDIQTDFAGITSITCSNSAVHFPSTASTALPEKANQLVCTVATGVGSITLKVVAAAAYGIYVDGKPVTSGQDSAAINLAVANSVTEATVRVDEKDKASRFVKVYIARA